jgi:hypothetical protein
MEKDHEGGQDPHRVVAPVKKKIWTVVFWDMSPCSLVDDTKLSEEHAG